MTNLPTGTVTFLFTDIQGSTQLWQQHPQAMPGALARHHAILREAIEADAGYVFQIIGDAFCAAFHTGLSGLSAALAAQRRLRDEAWGETGPVRVRMALHTGAAELRAGDYASGEYVSGITLSRAARLLSAGHGGQVLLSRATVEQLTYNLPGGLSLRDLGQRRLKDLQQPEHIYQLVAEGLPVEFPPLKTLDALPNNLPVQLTSFIGRERELVTVKGYLLPQPTVDGRERASQPARLLTLTGVGGTGKTRLALQAAAETLEEFPDGAWLVELAPLSDPQFLPQSVASALNLPEQPGRGVIETVLDFLRSKRTLLVLDNCEHLLDATARLADRLLRACPKVHILATSREPLGIAGETIWSVPSLSLPQAGASLDELEGYEAVRLFVERAASARHSFVLSGTNAAGIAQICRRLDGIPLAIELAAARVRSLSPEQIAARLDDRFRLLTGGSRTALPRQQTLQAMIDWSYSLLSDEERIFFRRLSVFSGGWNLDAAEAVCAGGSIEPQDVLDLLARLVDKSMAISEEDGGETRYRMLETIRQYARDKLFDTEEASELHQRHLEWMAALGKSFEAVWYLHQGKHWIARMDLELDNLRAALSWGIEQPGNLELAFELAGSVWLFWYFRSHWVEGRQWVERCLQAGEAQPVSPGRRGKVLYAAAGYTFFQGELEAAKTYTQASLEACQQAGDQLGLAINLHHAGGIAMSEGRLGQSELYLQEGLKLAQDQGNGLIEGTLIVDLGNLYAYYLNDLPRAYELFQQDLTLSRRIGKYAHYALTNLAQVSLEMGQLELAQSYIQQAIEANQVDYEPRSQGFIRDLQARLASTQGEHLRARLLWLESLEFHWNIRERDTVLVLLEQLAQNAAARHELPEAVRLLAASQSAYQQLGIVNPKAEKMQSLMADLRTELGAPAFERAWAGGQSPSLEAVVEGLLEQK